MSDLAVFCVICGEPVDPLAPYVRQAIRGFQVKGVVRPSGTVGGSDIELRETLQEWAHPECVSLEKSRRVNGVSPYQEKLV